MCVNAVYVGSSQDRASVIVLLSLFFLCTHTEVIINEECEGMPFGSYAAVSPVAAEVPGSRESNLS